MVSGGNIEVKLSKAQTEALRLLIQEEFYLQELNQWNFWKAYNSYESIRTDTMKALEVRKLVNIQHKPCNEGSAMAKITELGRETITNLR